MAPDDAGDIARTHDYVKTRDNVQSTFVWVPEFWAFQLVNPGATGASNSVLPRGAWVRDEPATGSPTTDWASESFGGFYVGKFEASRVDAQAGSAISSAGATAGTATVLKVAQYCVPWTNIDWDTARQVSRAYDPKADLMSDKEWAALAIYATISGTRVFGNTFFLRDKDQPSVAFLGDPTYGGGRSLTGSGRAEGLAAGRNQTTHTGTVDGVYDLNGNVFEWTSSLGLRADSTDSILVDDIETKVTLPETGDIVTLATRPDVRRLGLPGPVAPGAKTAYFGGAFLFKSPTDGVKAFRGGSWGGGKASGIWYLALGYPRSYSFADLGFRPVLRY